MFITVFLQLILIQQLSALFGKVTATSFWCNTLYR